MIYHESTVENLKVSCFRILQNIQEKEIFNRHEFLMNKIHNSLFILWNSGAKLVLLHSKMSREGMRTKKKKGGKIAKLFHGVIKKV